MNIQEATNEMKVLLRLHDKKIINDAQLAHAMMRVPWYTELFKPKIGDGKPKPTKPSSGGQPNP